ncbi:hypothetical protein M0813_04872 [Anaeramoeba flamelloides]|uniref:Uncharacterized protein n=1 Tax=Anaeramoeba flamelloides TaxID=1746091 RepID=A0AAV7ZIL7_9EUKA|nr:hypothetical protein M0812_13022 [Anaeramoeba flamelloides]KAJ6232351.1 hypothetical protein M0813_04872 [Anaeramoeba flamelloides]
MEMDDCEGKFLTYCVNQESMITDCMKEQIIIGSSVLMIFYHSKIIKFRDLNDDEYYTRYLKPLTPNNLKEITEKVINAIDQKQDWIGIY